MSGRLTLWGAGELLQSFFTRDAEPPAYFYLALIRTISPTPYVSGDELDEPDIESGYARVEISNELSTWGDGSGQLNLVANQLEIPFITALTDWGHIGYWALCNTDTGGYVYFVGDLEEDHIIYAGDQAVIGAGALVVELGPFFTEEDDF